MPSPAFGAWCGRALHNFSGLLFRTRAGPNELGVESAHLTSEGRGQADPLIKMRPDSAENRLVVMKSRIGRDTSVL